MNLVNVNEVINMEWQPDLNINEVIAANRKLVWLVINRDFPTLVYGGRGYGPDDVEQMGLFAVWKAYKTYHPDKGAVWSNYAYRLIKNEILMMLRPIRRWSKESHSMDTITVESDNGAGIKQQDMIECKTGWNVNHIVESDSVRFILERVVTKLTSAEMKVFRAIWAKPEDNDRMLSITIGISRCYVCRLRHSIQIKWRKVEEDMYE